MRWSAARCRPTTSTSDIGNIARPSDMAAMRVAKVAEHPAVPAEVGPAQVVRGFLPAVHLKPASCGNNVAPGNALR
jgi:hypothetical protein